MSEENILKENLHEAAYHLKTHLQGRAPEIGIILGSGLGPLAEQVEDAVHIPFGDIPHMKRSTATSHVGRFVCGTLAGKCVLVMQGRLHGYEGNTAQQVAFPVWIMRELGVSTLITTNAAGAINASYEVGDFCIMNDHINFTGRNPVAGQEPDGIAFRFFSMKDAYDPQLREIAHSVAAREDIKVQEGVYLGLLGPSFETPAEIRFLRTIGADAVGMSTVPEAIAANHAGCEIIGISFLSNMAAGVLDQPLSGEEVTEAAAAAKGTFTRVLDLAIQL